MADDTVRCASLCCGAKPVTVFFIYVISQGPQRVPLCDDCARKWQKDFGGTAAGSSLAIEVVDG